jgi:putative hydrolase of the HAD superfamily
MPGKTRAFDVIAFDLDDTLLDTSRQLVPQAARESCLAMITAGLDCDPASIDECLEVRYELSQGRARRDLYGDLVLRFGTRPGADAEAVARAGREAFHNREVEQNITLLPGARDLLHDLRSRYSLHLVTAGHRPTQEAKIRILGIASCFDGIHHIDPSQRERKGTAFAAIQRASGSLPERHLSVGNRLDTDIAEARQIGWKGCWMRYGEYAHLEPECETEKPDFIITSLEEFITACRL